MMPVVLKTLCFIAFLLVAFGLHAQKEVGDTLRFSVLSGGSLTVPEGEEWRFLNLNYSEGAYGMAVKWEGPDTLKAKYTWVAPMWSVESQLLGDGKQNGMYQLKVIKLQ